MTENMVIYILVTFLKFRY